MAVSTNKKLNYLERFTSRNHNLNEFSTAIKSRP